MRSFDYSKLQNQLWDTEILQYIAQISEYKGKQSLYLQQKPVVLDRLLEIAKVQSTEASNKIEGIVTTSTRVQQLCEEKTTPRNRDEQEIAGYRDALELIHENYEYIDIKPSFILQLHRELYRYAGSSFGGKFKNTPNVIAETRVDGTQVVRFQPLAPYETPQAIEIICEQFNHAIDTCSVDPLILIPIFINDFLCIHPFNDGNGRMSRLLTTLLLYRCGFVVGRYISLEKKIEKNKAQYYDVLRQSGIGWHEENNDPTPFVKYLLGMILASYRDFEERIYLVDEKVPAIELVRHAIDLKIGKFTKSEIMELVPSLGKTSVQTALRALVENDYIEKHGQGKATFYVKK
ncbi:MAG: Fic family protein [Peptococcaceae bacterium]|nr:Fic family protein [Peptococcaceae bacterium]